MRIGPLPCLRLICSYEQSKILYEKYFSHHPLLLERYMEPSSLQPLDLHTSIETRVWKL